MIEGVKTVWLALSDNPVACCCEATTQPKEPSTDIMPIQLFESIAAVIRDNGWTCRVLIDHRELPPEYAALCRTLDAQIIVPNTYQGGPLPLPLTVVFDQTSCSVLNRHLTPESVVVRVRRKMLGRLASQVKELLGRTPLVQLRHPELLEYEDSDFSTYVEQLAEIGQSLLARGPEWATRMVDCLNGNLLGQQTGECGAGDTQLAIGADGSMYLCPALMNSGQSFGNILGEVVIPDRHLLTRKYSLLCSSVCTVDHCTRCVHQNKLATREYGVPPSRVCKLAHLEQNVRATLTAQAKAQGWWNENWKESAAADRLDPFTLLKAEEQGLPSLWASEELMLAECPNPHPGLMLDIIHEVQGIVRAARRCAEAGCTDLHNKVENTPLARARRRTVEAYRTTSFGPGCPTILELQEAICDYVSRANARQD